LLRVFFFEGGARSPFVLSDFNKEMQDLLISKRRCKISLKKHMPRRNKNSPISMDICFFWMEKIKFPKMNLIFENPKNEFNSIKFT